MKKEWSEQKHVWKYLVQAKMITKYTPDECPFLIVHNVLGFNKFNHRESAIQVCCKYVWLLCLRYIHMLWCSGLNWNTILILGKVEVMSFIRELFNSISFFMKILLLPVSMIQIAIRANVYMSLLFPHHYATQSSLKFTCCFFSIIPRFYTENP